MNLDQTIADLPETSTIDRLSLEALRSEMEEQAKYEVNKTRFGAYVTICCDDAVYCLPITDTQMQQLKAIGGDFIGQLKEVFQCSQKKEEKNG